MLGKSQITVAKELDLVKFFKRQRISMYAILTLLNGRQQYVIDNLSNMLMRESSDFDDSTDDDKELDLEKVPDIENHGSNIFKSKMPKDQRLVSLYRIKREKDDRKKLKFNKHAYDDDKKSPRMREPDVGFRLHSNLIRNGVN